MPKHDHPRANVADIQRGNPGLWVAVKDGEVVDARLNAHALILSLHERGVRDAIVFRCPEQDEPELVGLG